MISESLYIEMMKNCSKWNSRVETERKGRYTVLDPQTGIAQHPSHHAIYELSNRYPPSNPSQYCTYGSRRWKKRKSAPTSDATEMKYILECNPAISDVINQASSAGQDPTDFQSLTAMANSSLENHFTEKRKVYIMKESGVDMEVEEASEEDLGEASDEEEWSDGRKKRKRRGAAGGSRGGRKNNATTLSVNIPPTQGFTPDPKPFSCNLCGAKYKSRPGLNYHRAHVHADNVSPSTTPQPAHLLSPSIDVSTVCDLCLGDCNQNKKTMKPEQLISCHDCGRSGHPSCLKFTDNMLTSTGKYGWQCIECKSCAICGFSDNDDQLLFCDDCDRGFHLYCLRPPLPQAPEGEWSCHLCQKQFGAQASLPAINIKA
ncbi:unnamed protein product [Litomosoides sigmodontis]|uniref:PHD finger protein 10 n=1 Tax=Litomosoides sigmodontis TaxID=42156 RepID=A0A3P6V4D6_LITSI|nr:unnamed protein product [Litomosoides sigmodontis]